MATDDKSDDKKSLILKWLTQWRDQSRQHGSKLEYVYGKVSFFYINRFMKNFKFFFEFRH